MNRMKRCMLAWLMTACMAVFAVPLPAMAAQADLLEQRGIAEGIPIDESHFPDEYFRDYVKGTIDTDEDGQLSVEEQEGVTSIDCSGYGISDLTGIEHFSNLAKLGCSKNNLSSLDVSGNPALEKLDCIANNLTSLDVSKNETLAELYCPLNKLSSLDVSGCPALRVLDCGENNLSSLDVSGCPALEKLYCNSNDLSSLDVSGNSALMLLSCSGNNLSSLDVSDNPALTLLYCESNNLSSLDVSGNPALMLLSCSGNNLSSLDVSGNPALTLLSCESNNLSSLNVSGNPALKDVYCSDNHYSISRSSDNTFDLSKLPGNFDVSMASDWQGGSVSGNILTVNADAEQVTYIYDVDGGNGNRAAKFTLNIHTHSYDAGKETKAATCKEEGVKTYTCTVCGATKTEAIAKLKTHSYDAGKITKAATCKEEGVKTYTCTVCKATRTEKIPIAAHTYKTTVVKATLKKDGKSTTACTVCGRVKSTKSISHPASITLKETAYTYDGKAKKPGVVIMDAAGKTVSSSNYSVSYEKGRKSVGRYKVTVTFKGNYSGTKSLSFTITPPAPELNSVTAGSKKLTVKWKKGTQATGYELQYSTSKNFTKNTVKTVNIKNKATVKKTITGLKAKKTYYVRIRTYKTVSGKKYYSAWSSPMKAVTKK